MKKEKKEGSKGKAFLKYAVIILAAMFLSIAYVMFCYSDELAFLRNSDLFWAVVYSSVSAVFLFFIWRRNKRSMPLLLKIAGTVALFPMFLLPFFIDSDRVMILIWLGAFYALLGSGVFCEFFAEEKRKNRRLGINTKPIFVELIILGKSCFRDTFRVEYTEEFFLRPFWWIALFCAVAVLLFILIFGDKMEAYRASLRKEKKRPKKVPYCRLSVWTVTILTLILSYFTAATLNLACDFSEPEHRVAVITDKDSRPSGRRYERRGYHRFTLEHEGGEMKLEVTLGEYNYYDIGDRFPLDIYDGAFGVEYYVSGNMD